MTTSELAVRPDLPTPPASFLIYGDSESGKTVQIGLFAKWLFKQTGGKIVNGKAVGGLRLRLYCADNAGYRSIQPYVNLGLIEVVNCLTIPQPWLWAEKICDGLYPDMVAKKWVADRNASIGAYAFDGLTGINDELMKHMAEAAGKGVNIGGGGSTRFEEKGDWGNTIIGTNNQTHYGVAQNRTVMLTGRMNRLIHQPAYVIATATARRGTEDTQSPIMGPQVAGKALTSELPRLFTYTFHLTTVVRTNADPEYRLYFVNHQDETGGMVKSLANRRVPMVSPKKLAEMKLPQYVAPADMVEAYQIILKAEREVELELAKELA